MAHQTVYNPETKIIETRLTGTVNAEEVVAIIEHDIELTIQNDCYLWLNDYTSAEEVCNMADVANFRTANEDMAKKLGKDRFKIRRAIVGNLGDANFKFAQAVSGIKGQILMVFDTIDEARTWLRS